MSQDRISFDDYFLELANLVAKRATCPRKHVGAVAVKDGKVLSTGYNGAPKGFKHCSEVGCLIKNNHCVRVVHAEMNAILFAGKEARGATLYCNLLPCPLCFKLAIQAGIKEIVYQKDYNKSDLQWLFDESRIEVRQIGKEEKEI